MKKTILLLSLIFVIVINFAYADSNTSQTTETSTSTQENQTCTDTDGGNNIYEAGESSDSAGKGHFDICDFTTGYEKGILKEAICENGNSTTDETKCPSNAPYCNRGACSSEPPKCEDTDGTDPYTQGTITEVRTEDGPQHTDYCENINTFQYEEECSGSDCGVREYYCLDSYYSTLYKDIGCPEGCKDGKCLGTPSCKVPDSENCYETEDYDSNGCPVYVCEDIACSMPACEGAYYTGDDDSYGCPIYKCPPTQSNNSNIEIACSEPICEGSYDTGNKDKYGCPIIACPPTITNDTNIEIACSMPACENVYYSGYGDKYGCPIYLCPPTLINESKEEIITETLNCPEECVCSGSTITCPNIQEKEIITTDCPEGCVCTKETMTCEVEEVKAEEGCMMGCKLNDTCVIQSTRTIVNGSQMFCDIGSEWKTQLKENSVCNNNYECSTNLCIDGECMSSGLIKKVIAWFQKIF